MGDVASSAEVDKLESRVFQVKAKEEGDFDTSASLEKWQSQVIELAVNSTGANKSKVTKAAFSLGLERVRDRLHEDELIGLADLREYAIRLYGGMNCHQHTARFTEAMITDPDWDMRIRTGNMHTVPVTVRIPDSMFAEAMGHFSDAVAASQSAIVRALLAAGMKDSSITTSVQDERCQQMVEEFCDSVTQARQRVEGLCHMFIASNLKMWCETGITIQRWKLINEIQELARDEQIVDHIERCIETIEKKDLVRR